MWNKLGNDIFLDNRRILIYSANFAIESFLGFQNFRFQLK